MRTYALGFCISCAIIAAASVDLGLGCKPAETAIFDLGDAECALLAEQPNELVAEVIACEVFDAVQNVIQTFTVRMPTDQVASFLAQHPVKAGHPKPAGAMK